MSFLSLPGFKQRLVTEGREEILSLVGLCDFWVPFSPGSPHHMTSSHRNCPLNLNLYFIFLGDPLPGSVSLPGSFLFLFSEHSLFARCGSGCCREVVWIGVASHLPTHTHTHTQRKFLYFKAICTTALRDVQHPKGSHVISGGGIREGSV